MGSALNGLLVLDLTRVAGSPIRFPEHPQQDYRPSPLPGQHSRSVRSKLLGLTDDEVERA